MTTITLYGAPTEQIRLLEKAFAPDENLLLALIQMAASSNVFPPYSFTAQNQEGENIKVTSSRLIGKQPLLVQVETNSLGALDATVMKLEAKVENLERLVEMVDILAIPQIRITAREIVKTVMGASFEKTVSSHPAMVALASIACMSSCDIAIQMNFLLDRCNNDAPHVTSLQELDEVVMRNRPLLNQKIRRQMKWEAWVLDEYAEIKKRLPTQFC